MISRFSGSSHSTPAGTSSYRILAPRPVPPIHMCAIAGVRGSTLMVSVDRSTRRMRPMMPPGRLSGMLRVVYPQKVQPDLIEVVVEIPRGSRNKYELDKERGVMRLDRVLYSSVHYPTDYGFVVGTLAE